MLFSPSRCDKSQYTDLTKNKNHAGSGLDTRFKVHLYGLQLSRETMVCGKDKRLFNFQLLPLEKIMFVVFDTYRQIMRAKFATLCTHWSLTGNIAPLPLVVTRGRLWLVHRRPYRSTVTRRGWMLWVRLLLFLKQESSSLITNKMSVILVTQESGLVQEGLRMTPTHVVTLLVEVLTMETKTSKPWVISWCSETKADLKTF